jgi:hypothetical protein
VQKPDELAVSDVLKHMREYAGEQAQQIAMLRAALAKATTPQATHPTTEPPHPTE